MLVYILLKRIELEPDGRVGNEVIYFLCNDFTGDLGVSRRFFKVSILKWFCVLNVVCVKLVDPYEPYSK